MNLRKNLGRVASTIVATALLASVATVPAFAVGEPGETEEQAYTYTAGEKFTITKNLKVPANVMTPDATFTFNVDPDDPTEGQTIGGVEVTRGKVNGVAMDENGGADFNPGTTAPAGTESRVETGKASFTVNLDAFDTPGIYKYTVSEITTPNYEGVTYTQETKDLYVFIEYVTDEDGDYVDSDKDGNTDLKVAYTMLVKADQDASTQGNKDDKFENDYGVTTDTLHDLTVTKNITGNAANLSDTFTFKITVTDADVSTEKYVAIFGDDTVVMTSGTEQSFTLGNDDSVTIYGLSAGDTYKIVEDYGAHKNYTTSATVNGSAVTLTGNDDKTTYEDNDGIGNADVAVVYTNDKSYSTPTGIVMNVAPYALLVVVAVAGCFVFLRKRNED